MLLTLTCTAPNATDLGFLLHKNPASLFSTETSFGTARVFYPEAGDDRCTAALQVEIDPVALVRGRNGKGGQASGPLAQYVSDRPYAPSSFLSVALGQCFSTAMGGRSKERPERVSERMPLSVTLYALDAGPDGPDLLRRLFGPLGYGVAAEPAAPLLDDRFPQWGPANVYNVSLTGEHTVQALLTHLYVLIPVFDNAKHYFFGDDEVDKLVRRGEGWLESHPEKEMIARRYLRYKRPLADAALARLAEVEEAPSDDVEVPAAPDAPEVMTARGDTAERTLESPLRLHERRIQAAVEAIRIAEPAPKRVIDLGCGEGRTVEALLKGVPGLEHVAGMDVSASALERAARRLHLDRLGDRERERVSLFQGSLVYRDARLSGYDSALLTEVIEHLDPERLSALVRVVFEGAQPRRVIVTTPNAEYNAVWLSLPAGRFRHPDHRFEWTRAEFAAWGEGVGAAHGYTVAFSGIGDEDADGGRGTPTQMAVFDRKG